MHYSFVLQCKEENEVPYGRKIASRRKINTIWAPGFVEWRWFGRWTATDCKVRSSIVIQPELPIWQQRPPRNTSGARVWWNITKDWSKISTRASRCHPVTAASSAPRSSFRRRPWTQQSKDMRISSHERWELSKKFKSLQRLPIPFWCFTVIRFC